MARELSPEDKKVIKETYNRRYYEKHKDELIEKQRIKRTEKKKEKLIEKFQEKLSKLEESEEKTKVSIIKIQDFFTRLSTPSKITKIIAYLDREVIKINRDLGKLISELRLSIVRKEYTSDSEIFSSLITRLVNNKEFKKDEQFRNGLFEVLEMN